MYQPALRVGSSHGGGLDNIYTLDDDEAAIGGGGGGIAEMVPMLRGEAHEKISST